MHIKICEKGSILSHFYVAFLFFINILLPFFLLSLSDSLSLSLSLSCPFSSLFIFQCTLIPQVPN